MTDIVDRIMRLWSEPPGEDGAAAESFQELYTDPVLINSAPLTAEDLVAVRLTWPSQPGDTRVTPRSG